MPQADICSATRSPQLFLGSYHYLGSRTVNTDPLPGSLATVTSPPIMRASLRETAGRQCCGFCRMARRDESGRRVRCNMRARIKLCAGYRNPNWVAAVTQWVTTPANLKRPGQVPGPLASVGGSGRLYGLPVSPRTNARAVARLRLDITDRDYIRRLWQVR